jgi:site-specific DNA-methyltransferase (adenine-specific)
MIKQHHANVIDHIQTLQDLSKDFVFCDPPYLLGSELKTHNYTDEIINKIQDNEIDSELFKMIEHNNKLDVKGSGTDFMSKWKALKGKDLEIFFRNSFRILKHGGFLIMYGMEEAGALFNYYASMVGFEINQSIYYFYGSSFPKNVNLSKAIDSRLGEEREIIKIKKRKVDWNRNSYQPFENNNIDDRSITQSNSELGQKYEGYHAGKKPLKANTEIIYVFHKPTKHGTYIEDLMQYEAGDKTIHVSAFDIDGNRIEYNKEDLDINIAKCSKNPTGKKANNVPMAEGIANVNKNGRYPSQLLFDPAMADRLDEQSGFLHPSGNKNDNNIGKDKEYKNSSYQVSYRGRANRDINDVGGGASRFFSVIPYFNEEKEKFIWSSKVSRYERNAGLYNFEDKETRYGKNFSSSDKGTMSNSCKQIKNNHPTLKNMNLNKKILDFFKTPNRTNETIYIPFSGVWSEVIPAVASGFLEENIECCEMTNTEEEPYIDIGQARYEFWKENDFFFTLDNKKEFQKAKKKSEKKKEKEIDIFNIDKQENI